MHGGQAYQHGELSGLTCICTLPVLRRHCVRLACFTAPDAAPFRLTLSLALRPMAVQVRKLSSAPMGASKQRARGGSSANGSAGSSTALWLARDFDDQMASIDSQIRVLAEEDIAARANGELANVACGLCIAMYKLQPMRLWCLHAVQCRVGQSGAYFTRHVLRPRGHTLKRRLKLW